MRRNLKRALAALAALAVSAGIAPFTSVTPAHALGTRNGSLTLAPSSGTSATTFTIDPVDPQDCPGDGATDGYRWQTFMAPTSVDPATLQFQPGSGPIPQGGAFTQPLFDTSGNPVIDRNPDIGTKAISGIPSMDLAVFGPGVVPAGEYNIGIACTLGAPGPDQLKTFWSLSITITDNPSGGPSQLSYAQGAKPAAPSLTSVTAGSGSLTAAFTPTGTADPAVSSFTATATPTGGGASVSQSGASSPITITGLTNGTEYGVVVTATNAVGTSAASNAMTGTPAVPPRQPVTGLTASPGTGSVDLSWTAPSDGPTGYLVEVAPAHAGPFTTTSTAQSVPGLTAGTLYTFTVTPQHATPPNGTPATVTATPYAAQVLKQDITVTRPAGVLILTQVCGKNGPIPAFPDPLPGYPTGLPAVAGDDTGTAPTDDAGNPDPQFANYPEPSPASYPTHCGIDLGTATFVSTGEGGGQFYKTDGVLNQVSVLDTRDVDDGWTVNGTMGDFAANGGTDSFSGSQLGWMPVMTDDSEPFTANGGTYDQTVVAGATVDPNEPAGTGLAAGSTLASADAGAGRGVAYLDARLVLLIPVTADAGDYEGTLTLTSV